MNIVDIFPYFNEKEILELRINLLYDYVDQFIICEANRTQSGLVKEFTAKNTIDELELPKDKITVIEYDLSSYDTNSDSIKNWHRERAQRNIAKEYISLDDICIVSDCDEIIDPKYIDYYADIATKYPNNILRIPLINLSGRADLEVCDPIGHAKLWCSAFFCLYHHVQKYTLSEIREAHSMINSTFMYSNVEFPDIFITENDVVQPAGWHFSWMGNANRMLEKYHASMHVNDHILDAVYTYSDKSIEDFIKEYKPKEGATDSLGRRNYLLKHYPQEKLPDKLHQLQRVKQFLLPKKKKILFHDNHLGKRGTTVALYDYAYFGRKYLDLDPIITFNNTLNNNQESILRFQQEFKVVPYDNFDEINNLIEQQEIDYFYAIKYGTKDNIYVTNAKNLIHSVFNYDVNEMHGDVYAVISKWLSQKSNNIIPYVEHMVNLESHNDDFRAELNIPNDAVVIGRYGGYDTFNIPFVYKTIQKILDERSNIFFLFVNTPQYIDHQNCYYIDQVIKQYDKTKFINSCDAFIHARDYGETFGLAIAEFASKNKQIISYDNEELQNLHPLGGRNHFLYLENNCLKYKNKFELYGILTNITRTNSFDTTYIANLFSPEVIMNQFNKVFLS